MTYNIPHFRPTNKYISKDIIKILKHPLIYSTMQFRPNYSTIKTLDQTR